MKTKQHSQATTIENLKSETSWEFHALLIKQTECIPMAFHLGLVCYKIDPFDETILHEIYQNFLVSFISKIAWENICEFRPFIHEHGDSCYR